MINNKSVTRYIEICQHLRGKFHKENLGHVRGKFHKENQGLSL